MMKLINQNSKQIICEKLILAKGFFARGIGLIGKNSFSKEQGLWIKNCNSIHTHFMRFPIDVIYLDSQLKVIKIKTNVPPWRFTLPVLGAHSVVEMLAQNVEKKVKEGESLYVDA